MGRLSALGPRKQSRSLPLLYTDKAITVAHKALVTVVGAEEIGPAAIVLVGLGVAEIELLPAHGVFEGAHLDTPSVEHHARNVEASIGMEDLAGNRSAVVAGQQHGHPSDLAGINRAPKRGLRCSLGEELIEMLDA